MCADDGAMQMWKMRTKPDNTVAATINERWTQKRANAKEILNATEEL